MRRKVILNQYRTEEGRRHWAAYARGERRYGTRHNLMSYSARPDLKTTSVMAQGGVIRLTY